MTTRTRTTSRRSTRTTATEVNQTSEATAETPATLTTQELVAKFLEGGEGTTGNFSTSDGTLYVGRHIAARRTSDGSVVLPTTSASDVELNDQLMGQIFAGQKSFRRLGNFVNLTSSDHRLAELNAGSYDDFKAAASLFGFESSEEDYAALERAKEFRTRVSEFFDKIATTEADRVRSSAEKEKLARKAKMLADWDAGEGRATNWDIDGEGGGQRLRLSAATTSRTGRATPINNRRIYTSHGQELTYGSAKRAFDFASLYWHGGQSIPYRGARQTRGSYATVVTESNLNYGCQNVTRAEAERFARAMGWEFARAAANAESAAA